MTNLPFIVTLWVNLVTNPVPSGMTEAGLPFREVSSVSSIQDYLPDGAFLNCSTMTHHSWVTNEPALSRTLGAFKADRGFRLLPPLPVAHVRVRRADREQAGRPANGGPDNTTNFCAMFRTAIGTQTNLIYRLEYSTDLINWALLPPEIDGTGNEEFFYDILSNPIAVYRIAARTGILPDP